MRQKLQRAARKVDSRGSLNDLVRILDNKKNQLWDEKGYALARRRYHRLDREVQRIKTDSHGLRRQARRLGQQLAANIASVVSVIVLVILVVNQVG